MDPSDLFEADQASGLSSQIEDNTGMEPVYYYAAEKGEIRGFKNIEKSHINLLLTPNRNTILHIYLTSLTQRSKESKSPTAFVQEILRTCPLLLSQANVKGEIPLHIAARYGHDTIVKVLIDHAKVPQQDLESGVNILVKEMLEMMNNEKDTALHEAVRNNHLEVVKLLIEEGPDFSYSQNEAGETPLYIAVERGSKEVMDYILDKCTSPAHDGPLGRTTLHAALIWNNTGMMDKILASHQEPSAFVKQADEQHSTPLHYAVYRGNNDAVKMLLKVDRSIAYMRDTNGMTALHIAAHKGNAMAMRQILEYCPDCCELVDNRSWNALHFAVNSSSDQAENIVPIILSKSSLSNILNEKDAKGATPLHHYSKSLKYIKNLIDDDRVDKMAFNKENLDAYDIVLNTKELSDEKFMQIERAFEYNHRPSEFRRPLGEAKQDAFKRLNAEREAVREARKVRFYSIMEKATQVHLVVDTLIATVAFTAGITMPGGFRGLEGPHPGSAVLMRNAAFRAFVITNTIALVLSCLAAFIHLFMPLLSHKQNLELFSLLLALAFCLSISAMGAMVMAFVTGTYAVLMHSLDLAISNCLIVLCFFILVLFISIECSHYLNEIWSTGISWCAHKFRKR
ncbi:ankyrin repeat-containing protein At5g02620-like isoform X1 [Quercus lobata]|uniref:PGG domain-containing protein n=1 Tax=Quercus lobata TaxID=97700 RepID=A0A7N2MTP5_QUELO|nr:ankyrin repeat-containing protein At5g02620-like isoform X1 [Quercus lobata]